MAPSSSRPLSVEPVRQQIEDSRPSVNEGSSARFSCEPLLEHLQPQLVIERADLGDEAALQPRAHALVEPSSGWARRAEATTTWRPPSSSELMMWSNSCSVARRA